MSKRAKIIKIGDKPTEVGYDLRAIGWVLDSDGDFTLEEINDIFEKLIIPEMDMYSKDELTSLFDQLKFKNAVRRYSLAEATIAQWKQDFMVLKIKDKDDKDTHTKVYESRQIVKKTRTGMDKHRKMLLEPYAQITDRINDEYKYLKAEFEAIEAHLQSEEDKFELMELEAKEAEEKMKRERVKGRTEILSSMGMEFDGVDYVFVSSTGDRYELSFESLKEYDDDRFQTYVEMIHAEFKVKAQIAIDKANEEAKKKREADEEAERVRNEAEDLRLKKEILEKEAKDLEDKRLELERQTKELEDNKLKMAADQKEFEQMQAVAKETADKMNEAAKTGEPLPPEFIDEQMEKAGIPPLGVDYGNDFGMTVVTEFKYGNAVDTKETADNPKFIVDLKYNGRDSAIEIQTKAREMLTEQRQMSGFEKAIKEEAAKVEAEQSEQLGDNEIWAEELNEVTDEFPLMDVSFWDKFQERFGPQLDHFINWINSYQDKVKWDGITELKYYQLPPAMQLGIFIQYSLECGNIVYLADSHKDLIDQIANHFIFMRDGSVI